MESSQITVLGADARQQNIYKILKGIYETNAYGMPGQPPFDEDSKLGTFVVLPTVASKDDKHINLSSGDEPLIEDFFKLLKKRTHLITGVCPDAMKALCTKYCIYLHEYTKEEAFKTLNAVPTAEGAIALAVEHTEKTLWQSKVLIIGNGCIGKALSLRLRAFGADVTVSARKPEDYAELQANGVQYIKTAEAYKELGAYDVIFNTVPKRIFTEDELLKLKKSQLFVDLASAPFGLDHEKADEYPMKVLKAGSLPGKFSPVTAAELAVNAICQTIEKVSNNG